MNRLSERENQILGCLARGCSNKAIARQLVLAEATVKVHIKSLLRKLQASNRTQAAVWALNNAIVEHEPASKQEVESDSSFLSRAQ